MVRRNWRSEQSRILRLMLFVAAIAMSASAQLADPARAETTPCLGATIEATAAEVMDIRTIRLEDGRLVRLSGIEPIGMLLPESIAPDAALKHRLGELLVGKPVVLQLLSTSADRHGRLPAMVALAGSPVQETLAHEGLVIAFATADALPCFDRILAAETAARGDQRGFWKDIRLPAAFPSELTRRIGRFAIFEGKVVSVGNRRSASYLNFGEWWSADVTVEIAAPDREKFGGEASLAAYAGRRVRVRGFLEEKAGPMLLVRSRLQMELID